MIPDATLDLQEHRRADTLQLSLRDHSFSICRGQQKRPQVVFSLPRACKRGRSSESGPNVGTSKYVGLVHVVCAEDSDSARSAALQQGPHLMPGAGVHACRGLVQEQDLKEISPKPTHDI